MDAAFVSYMDGQILPGNEAKISIWDRGFLFGDGAYVTIKVLEGVPLFLERHLEKLIESCSSLRILPPSLLKKEEVFRFLAAQSSYPPVAKLRILVTGGMAPGMHLPVRKAGHLLMILEDYPLPPYAPLSLKRFSTPFFLCHASFKSLAHLNRYYVMEEAKAAGFDDAFTTTPEGVILEAAFGNLLWIKERNAYTPDPTLPLHQGITIGIISEILREKGYNIQYARNHLEELPADAYYFRVNSMGEIRPIIKLENRFFARSESLEKVLKEAYKQRIEKERAAFLPPLSLQ